MPRLQEKRKEESRAGGVDVEYDEIYQALTNIHDQIVDSRGKREEKKQQLKR